MSEQVTLVTVNEAMAICGVSRQTIYNWFKGGKLKWLTLPSGSRRINTNDLVKLAPRVPTATEIKS